MRLREALAPRCSRPQRAKGPRARAGAAAVSTLSSFPFPPPARSCRSTAAFRGSRALLAAVRSLPRQVQQRPRLPPAWNEDCCGSPRGSGRAFDERIRSGGGAGHLRAARAGRVGRGGRPALRERRVAGHHAASRRPDGFVYVDATGQAVRDPETLARIRASRSRRRGRMCGSARRPRGHVQATGRDAKGRKQYRYHPRWRRRPRRDEVRPDGRLRAGAAADPRARRGATSRGRGCRARRCWPPSCGCSRSTLIRVGNEEYARQNSSFGLTTLRDRHVDVDGGRSSSASAARAGRRTRSTLSRRAPRTHRQAVPGPPGPGALPVPRRGRRARASCAPTDVNDVPARGRRRGLHGEGLPDLGGHRARGVDARGVRAVRDGDAGEAQRRARDRAGGRAPRQHAGGVPQVLRAPGGRRLVHGGLAHPDAAGAVLVERRGTSRACRARRRWSWRSSCVGSPLVPASPPEVPMPSEDAEEADRLARVRRVARERLGFAALRPEQEEAIQAVLGGRDTLAVLPTGSGKSAIYQIAGLLLEGPTIVVSPLIALQRDQVALDPAARTSRRRRRELDLAPARAGREALEAASERRLEFLLLAPGAARPTRTRSSSCARRGRRSSSSTRPTASASGATISAPTTSARRRARGARRAGGPRPHRDGVAARARRDRRAAPHARAAVVVKRGFDRPNIHLERPALRVEEDARTRALARRRRRARRAPGIVYVATRQRAEELARCAPRPGRGRGALPRGPRPA